MRTPSWSTSTIGACSCATAPREHIRLFVLFALGRLQVCVLFCALGSQHMHTPDVGAWLAPACPQAAQPGAAAQVRPRRLAHAQRGAGSFRGTSAGGRLVPVPVIFGGLP
jgi:hypothetical protein